MEYMFEKIDLGTCLGFWDRLWLYFSNIAL